MCSLLEEVIHLSIVESYERYRSIFSNEDIEIVVDEYPFGLCVEIENKSKTKDVETVIKEWLSKLKLDINEADILSWDDKYAELCKEQNKDRYNVVRFDKDMPKISTEFSMR